MKNYVIEMFVVSLFLTILIEMAILFFMREHSVKNMVLLILVNLLTNPAAVLCVWLIRICAGVSEHLWIQIPIEIIVVIVESSIYLVFSREADWKIKRPIVLGVLANLTSWMTGLVVQGVL